MAQQYLLPSEIRFSQDSISNTFSDALEKQQIGIALDKICNGDSALRMRIIENLAVGRSKEPGYDGLWFTVNNRSLWVLKELEVLGLLPGRLQVAVDPNGIDSKRFTTKDRGQSIIVRTYPVGGNKAVAANFWKYKKRLAVNVLMYKQLVSGASLPPELMAAEMADYDDGYDSDEYYH